MGKRFVKGSELNWQAGPFPGTRMKTYPAAAGSPTFSLLMEMAPGAALERHREPLNEVDYVISGSVEIEGKTLEAGDYMFTAAGEEHGPYRSPKGCMVLITKF